MTDPFYLDKSYYDAQPEEYAGQLEMMGAQYILPLHQTNARASDEDLNLYFQKVNKILEEKGCPARAFNPKPYSGSRCIRESAVSGRGKIT